MSTVPWTLAHVDLRRAFLTNLVASTGETTLRFLFGLALARLLQPAELGLYALTMGVFGIAQLLRDCGVSAYLQREPALTPARFSACLGLLLCTTSALTLALALGAPTIARWSGQPALVPLLQLAALGLPLSAFGGVMAALQLRELAAARIAQVSWLGVLTQGLLAIALSALGCGALGLVWAQLAAIAACGLAYAALRPAGLHWVPSWRGWQAVLGFGGASLFAKALTTLHAVVPNLLLGRLGAAHELGLLGRAQATVGLLQTLTGQALGFGALPVLAERHARTQSLAPAVLRAAALLTGLGWPLLALTVEHREPLVRLLYGAAWLDCTPAVLPLALLAAMGLPFTQLGAALAAVGKPAWAALPTAVALAARVLLCLALYDGTLASYAWGLCAAACISLPFQGWLARRHLGVSPRAAATALVGSAVATVAVVVVPWPLVPLAWLAALHACRHPLADEGLQLLRRRMTIRK